MLNISSRNSDSNFESSQNQMHISSRDLASFDEFLSHLKIPRVCLLQYNESRERKFRISTVSLYMICFPGK